MRNHHLNRHRSRITKQNKAIKNSFVITWKWLKEKIGNSVVAKLVGGGLVLLTGIVGFIYDQQIGNPHKILVIEGDVCTLIGDSDLLPINEAQIAVIDKDATTKTDHYGYFKLEVPVRHDDRIIELTCSDRDFYLGKKTIHIPISGKYDNAYISTSLHLKAKGYEPFIDATPPVLMSSAY